MRSDEVILRTEGLSRYFGNLRAVDDVNLYVKSQQLTSIIGPNGAGKTTLYNVLTGDLSPTMGNVYYNSEDITGLKKERVAQKGIARTYQIVNFFRGLTVYENIRISAQARSDLRFNLIRPYKTLTEVNEKADNLLDTLELTPFRDNLASELSHGDQKRLEIAIALANDPTLLLLDEPTAGIAPEETWKVIKMLKSLTELVTILLIEHDLPVVMNVSDEINVMHRGQIIATGSPEAIAANEQVQRIYVGELSEV